MRDHRAALAGADLGRPAARCGGRTALCARLQCALPRHCFCCVLPPGPPPGPEGRRLGRELVTPRGAAQWRRLGIRTVLTLAPARRARASLGAERRAPAPGGLVTWGASFWRRGGSPAAPRPGRAHGLWARARPRSPHTTARLPCVSWDLQCSQTLSFRTPFGPSAASIAALAGTHLPPPRRPQARGPTAPAPPCSRAGPALRARPGRSGGSGPRGAALAKRRRCRAPRRPALLVYPVVPGPRGGARATAPTPWPDACAPSSLPLRIASRRPPTNKTTQQQHAVSPNALPRRQRVCILDVCNGASCGAGLRCEGERLCMVHSGRCGERAAVERFRGGGGRA